MQSSRVRLRPPRAGFTYLTVLIILAILSGGLALVGEVWHTAARREKEAQLLFVGGEYRRAIQRYYLSGPGQYPRSLSDLIKDPRKPVVERYLRKLYPDPITGKNEWGLVKAVDGGIMGVFSLSEERPLKTANLGPVSVAPASFDSGEALRARKEAAAPKGTKELKYSDWKFMPDAGVTSTSGTAGRQGGATAPVKPLVR